MPERQAKFLPCGIADYTVLCGGDYVFVDKTKYIERLERSGLLYTFIVRPRRFGKTLFTSLLQLYYDKLEEENFQRYFGSTYIGSRRTKLANTFRVLHFDFSGLSSGNIRENFAASLKESFDLFLHSYPDEDCRQILECSSADPAMLLDRFMTAVYKRYGKTVYVLIDEYDQFANEILSQDKEQFKEIASSNGFLKNFYAKLKKATGLHGAVARIFMTGVTPISIDSMTSGFNIAANITDDPAFAAMFGFTEEELLSVIAEASDGAHSPGQPQDILARMKELYDGYSFSSSSSEHVFNPSMCFYYLRSLLGTQQEPRNLLDPSCSQDLSKIRRLLLMGGEDLAADILDALLGRKTIGFCSVSPSIDISSGCPAEEDIVSLLYYLGCLTLSEDKSSLKVPNRAVRRQFSSFAPAFPLHAAALAAAF